MQRNKLTKYALACLSCFVVLSNVSAQTQQQQNNPLDQLQPTDNIVNYDVPPVSERTDIIQNNRKFSVTSINLKRVVPNAAGNAIGELQPVDDTELNGLINRLLADTQNFPTYNQISALTVKLSQVLRRRGEILSTVYIPAQEVKEGALELHLLQGTLGNVEVTGQQTKSNDIIASAFEQSVGNVVTRDAVESQLLRIQNLLPGVSAQGTFRQGDRLGESDAIINVTGFDPFSGSVYIDNYGSASTGENRLGARFTFNNPFGWEDSLRIDILANETPNGFDDPQNPIEKDDYQCCFGGFSYEVFSDSLTFSYGIEWSHTQYDIGNNADFQLARLGFSGESDRTRLFFNYYSTLTSKFSETWTFGLSVSEADLFARNEAISQDVLLNRDQVPEYDLGYTFTVRSNADVYYGQIAAVFETDGYHQFPIPAGFFGYNTLPTVNAIGQTVGPSRIGSDEGNSFRLNADLNTIITSLTDRVRLKGRLAFQVTDDILAPIQQFSLAGPYGVRAYPSGTFLADSGVLASLDVQIPLASSAELSVFYDVGYGELNDVNEAAEFDATIQGAGVGISYRHSNHLALQLTASTGLSVTEGENGEPGPNIRNGGEEVTGRDDTQIFASLIYNF